MSDQPIETIRTRRGRGENGPPGRPWRFACLLILFVLILPQLESLLIPRILFMHYKLGMELWRFEELAVRLFRGDIQFYRISWSLCAVGASVILYTKLSESNVRRRFAIVFLLLALFYTLLIGSVILFSYFNARSGWISFYGFPPAF